MRKPGELLEPLRASGTTTWLETASVTVMKNSDGLVESAAKPLMGLVSVEGSTTRSVSPNNNLTHECPAPVIDQTG